MGNGSDKTVLYAVLGVGGLYLISKSGLLENIGSGLNKSLGALGDVGKGFEEIGAGLGTGVSGLKDTFGGIGTGIAGIGLGAGSGLQDIGAGVYEIGAGAGYGLGQIGAGAGYALSGANAQDLLQTVFTLGKVEASTYQVTPQVPNRPDQITVGPKIAQKDLSNNQVPTAPAAQATPNSYNAATGVYIDSSGQGYSSAVAPKGAVVVSNASSSSGSSSINTSNPLNLPTVSNPLIDAINNKVSSSSSSYSSYSAPAPKQTAVNVAAQTVAKVASVVAAPITAPVAIAQKAVSSVVNTVKSWFKW